MLSKALSGKQAQTYARRTLKQRGAFYSVTRPNPKPPVTRSILCMPQQIGAIKTEELKLAGITNLDGAMPVRFLFLPDADVKISDEIAYADAVYKLSKPFPQDYQGTRLYLIALGLVKR